MDTVLLKWAGSCRYRPGARHTCTKHVTRLRNRAWAALPATSAPVATISRMPEISSCERGVSICGGVTIGCSHVEVSAAKLERVAGTPKQSQSHATACRLAEGKTKETCM